jgi:hypothetical protein
MKTGKAIVSHAAMERPNPWSAAMNMDTLQRYIDIAICEARGEERQRAVEFVYDRSPEIAHQLLDSYLEDKEP